MILEWDSLEDRIYESGLDRGVLYLPDSTAVSWNGLVSVVESSDIEANPVYFDGMQIGTDLIVGSFNATLQAITYPDEFLELEGTSELKSGFFAGGQIPQTFGLSYRTQIGNSIEGSPIGYKIHILYNVLAVPSDVTRSTITGDSEVTPFEWKLSATPEDVPGIRPTAHFIIKTTDIDPWLLEELEAMLYGDETADPALPSMIDLVSYIRNWYRIQIIDNGDGTWTAITKRDDLITIDEDTDIFQITDTNAVYLNDYTFVISDS